MHIAELTARVGRWEDIRTELKLEAIQPDDLAAELVGFANAAGGGVPRIMRLVKQATGKDVTIQLREFEVLLSIPRKVIDHA